MENNADHDRQRSASASPPRGSENAGDVTEESSEDYIVVGERVLPTSSITISNEELKILEVEVEVDAGADTVSNQDDAESKAENSSTMDVEAKGDGKDNTQWKGFIRKLKKGPSVIHFQPFHPTLPHLLSIKKTSKKRNEKGSASMPLLPPDLDNGFSSCFRSSWINYSLAELEEATNNFSREHLIGEGGYSEVYKGHLENGQLVAIKRLIRGTPEEMTTDYLAELGILVHVNHPNIATVIGYGVDGGMHLILPLSVNGSLSSMLKVRKENLTWDHRYKIAVGIASGLAYLHEGCQRRIIHRDIKSANILLTEDLQPMVSDFGLAKWLPDQWTHITVSQIEGTFGYLPPEFFMHGIVDEKTDVYAYGVLLLEIISGRPAIDEANKSVVMWAKSQLLNRNTTELVDPAFDGNYNWEQLNRMVMVASLCIHQDSSERPQMSQALRMLKGDETVSPGNKKFQKRPALKRAPHPKEARSEDDNKAAKSSNNGNQKPETALDEKENNSKDHENKENSQNTS